MLAEQTQLMESVSLNIDTMPLGFVISDDGRTLLAVTGNDDGVIELMTTPVAFIQPNNTIVQPMIKVNNENQPVNSPVFQISLDNFTTANIQQANELQSESYTSVSTVSENEERRLNEGNANEISRLEVPSENLENSVIPSPEIKAKRRPGRPRKDAVPSALNADEKMKCDICGQEFTRLVLYRRHMQHHAEEKPHRCPKCPASFNVPTNFTLHMATHNTGEPKCPECGRKFARMASLKSHMLHHEREESLFCTECEDAFSTKAQLDAHLKLHNEKWSTEDVRKCKLCNKQFTQPALYRLHIREHYRTKIVKQRKKGTSHKTMYKCKICSKSFQKPSQLGRHIRIHTGEKPYKCTVCPRAFTQKGTLQIHMWKHIGIRPYDCQYCKAKFSQKGNLNAHLLRAHSAPEGEPIYGCTYCTCVFKKLGSLNGHMKRMHSNPEERPQKCDSSTESDIQTTVDNVMSQLASLNAEVRNQADSTNSSLPNNSKDDILQQALKNSGLPSKEKNLQATVEKAAVHTSFVTLLDRAPDGSLRRYLTIKQRCIGSVRWYACSFCNKEFKKPSDLIRHLRVHTQEKPFKCSFCYRSFALKSTMIAHERTHANETKHPCGTCNKSCACRSSLASHSRSHAKPHKCDLCDKSFSTSAMLKSHIKNHASSKPKISPEAENLVTQIVLEEPLVISDSGNKISVAHVQTKQNQLYDTGDVARPHKCWVCPSAFRKISHLKQHYRRHTGERPYNCPKCERKFTSNSVLKSHLRTHEESRPFSCSSCNAKFTTLSGMKRHLVTHSNKRPFMCPYCHKTFKTSVSCRKHMKIHKSELAQQQIEQQKTQQQLSPIKVKDLPELPDNLTLSEDIGVTFQTQIAPDFTQEFNEQFQAISSEKDKNYLADNEIGQTIDNQTLPVVDTDNLGTSQTLHADETGTITLPNYSGDQTLTPESIREIEETLNQQLFNIGLTDSSSVQLEPRNQPVLNIVYDNGKVLDAQTLANRNAINTNMFPSHFDTFDMSQITLQADTEIDLGITSANSTSMASILPRSAQEEQRLVPVTKCNAITDDLLSKSSSRHVMVVSSMQTCPELTRPIQACPKYPKVIAKADTTDGAENLNVIGKFNVLKSKTSVLSSVPKEISTFACELCNKRFSSQELLEAHSKLHSISSTIQPIMKTNDSSIVPESSMQCHMCRKEGFTTESLKRHLTTHRGEKEFQCTECSLKFCTNGGLSRHLKMHASKKQWKCPICFESLSTESQLKLHKKKHKNNTTIEPDSSQKDPTTLENFLPLPPATTISPLVTISSELSQSSITESAILNRLAGNPELSKEKKEYTNKCKFCPKTFRKPSDLIRHVRTHTGERPYKCEFCSKSFAVKCTLDCHMKVHTGAKTFCCHVCNSLFATKGSLKVHMRLHTGAKPFRCHTCDLRFRTSGHRKVHELTHTREHKENAKRKPKQLKISAIAGVVAEIEKNIEKSANLSVVNEEEPTATEYSNLDTLTIDASGMTDQITFNADGTILNNNSMLSINESNQLVANLHFLLANGLVTIQADESLLPQSATSEIVQENSSVEQLVATSSCLEQQQQVHFNSISTVTDNLVIASQLDDLATNPVDHQQLQLNDCMNLVQIPPALPEHNVQILETPVQTQDSGSLPKQTSDKIGVGSNRECDICGRIFMKPCQVERHKRTHTGERPYKCEICGKSFAQRSTLNVHQKHHTGDRPYPCPHCDYSFTQKGNLQTHLKRSHQLDTLEVKKIRRRRQKILSTKITQDDLDTRILNFDDISFVEFLK